MRLINNLFIKSYPAFFLALFLMACAGDPETATRGETQIGEGGAPRSLSEMNGLEGDFALPEFKLPDTLDARRLIAVYEEEIPLRGISYMLYTDSVRSLVVKVTHLRDASVKSERLLKLADNEFKSAFTEEKYLIRPASVYWSYTSGAISHSHEYARLDAAVMP